MDDDSKSGNAPGTKFKRHEISVVKEYAVFAAVFRQREVASHLLSNLLVLRIVEPVGELLVDAARPPHFGASALPVRRRCEVVAVVVVAIALCCGRPAVSKRVDIDLYRPVVTPKPRLRALLFPLLREQHAIRVLQPHNEGKSLLVPGGLAACDHPVRLPLHAVGDGECGDCAPVDLALEARRGKPVEFPLARHRCAAA